MLVARQEIWRLYVICFSDRCDAWNSDVSLQECQFSIRSSTQDNSAPDAVRVPATSVVRV